MKIKCLLFTKQFFSPIKTTVLNLPPNLSDSEIMELAKIEFMKDFHVEIEDVKNPRHKKYKGQLPNNNTQQPVNAKTAPRKNRTSIFEHNGKRYKRADIMKLHDLSPGQYNYLMNIKKYSPADIIEKGMDLYKQPRAS